MTNDEELWDELADQPVESDDQAPAGDEPVNTGTPYTDDATPETVDGTVLPEPIPDAPAVVLPDQVAAVIRTVTPYLVGLILSGVAWVLARAGVGEVPAGLNTWLTGVLPVVLGSLYYVAAKALEKRWPSVPWLGSRRQPLYTPPAVTTSVRALASTGYVWYKGGRFSPTFRDALVELDRLTPDVPLVVTQGGYNTSVSASAGTHAGDAVDFSVRGLTTAQIAKAVETARRVGIFLSYRTKAQGFTSNHLHGVPNGWGAPSAAAKRQIDWTSSNGTKWGYRNGRNGLALNGPDVGPGHVSTYRTRTWSGYNAAKNAPAASKAQVVVDGKFGPQTIKAVQKWLSVTQDGKFGPVTVKALQGALNRWGYKAGPVDGKFGPQTVEALQRQVKASPVDGKFGPVTVRALQNWLNRR